MKALVVDDSVTMQNMVAMTLKELGFEVVTAGDGVEAVSKNEESKFELIVTDINMPNMDGIEFIRNVRSEGANSNTPILVLTTEGGDNAKGLGREVGASGWLVKPYKPQVLKAAVAKVCGTSAS